MEHAGPKKWNRNFSLSEEKWEKIFTSLKNLCKETRLKEFHFKLIHRIIVTKKELYCFGIKKDDNCIYCGEKDSIHHTFRDCSPIQVFTQKVIDWFNTVNGSQFNLSAEEKLFGILSGSYEKRLLAKFNYTLLFMRYYIYTSKLHDKLILLPDFITRIVPKYIVEGQQWSTKNVSSSSKTTTIINE